MYFYNIFVSKPLYLLSVSLLETIMEVFKKIILKHQTLILISYFTVMICLCNIKISETSSRHNISKSLNDEIDGYTKQQLKTVSNESEIRNRAESIQETNETQSNSDNVKDKNKKVTVKKEIAGKIDVQAVINETTSLSENLTLNYEYLTQQALEKKEKSEPVSKSDEKDLSKERETQEPVNKDLVTKIKGHTKHNKTEKTKHHSKKKTINENKHHRDNVKDNDRKKDHNRHSKTKHSGHNNTGIEKNEKSKKKHHLLMEQSHEDIYSDKLQNPKLKGAVIQEESHISKEIKEAEEILSSISKENHKPPLSEEKNIDMALTEEGLEFSKEVSIEDENVSAPIGNKHSNKKNKMVAYDHANIEVKTTKFENSDDQRSHETSQERSAEVQITKKHEDKSPNKPIIREEGGKLYTYVKDPAYDDYHEELAEWRKKHPEKSPADFI